MKTKHQDCDMSYMIDRYERELERDYLPQIIRGTLKKVFY